MPDWNFRVWSDMDVPGATKLRHDWPKWWSKMEIYGDHFDGPALVVDIDTVFLSRWEPLPEYADRTIVLRNWYKDRGGAMEHIAGGFLYLQEDDRARIWDAWNARGATSVIRATVGDDQKFVGPLLGPGAVRIQDVCPDEVVSYKLHARQHGLFPRTKVVYFHGVPRPWDTDDSWIPPLPKEI
jgi:hypothetical protein